MPLKQDSSYKIESFAANTENEIKRLKAQVELFWDKEIGCLQRFGLRDGMWVLECGSGPGFVLEKLLQGFPGSRMVGVEIDPLLVEQSRQTLAQYRKDQCEIVQGSILNLDFPDDSFDFVISRLVLEHLPDPLSAIREVRRVLRTGGKAVFIDNDFDLHLRAYPDIPELHELYEAYCRCRRAEGGNPNIGRELPGLLHKGGFANVDLEIVAAHSRVIGDERFLRSEGSGIPAQLVKDGYLSRDAFDRLARKWHDTLQQQEHALVRQLFVAVGEKLTTQPSSLHAATRRAGHVVGRNSADDLSRLNPKEQHQHLVDYLQTRIAAALEVEKALIPVNRPLIELGLDSILSVELANYVIADFGVRVSEVDLLEVQSISALATLVQGNLDGGEQAGKVSATKDKDEVVWEEGEI